MCKISQVISRDTKGDKTGLEWYMYSKSGHKYHMPSRLLARRLIFKMKLKQWVGDLGAPAYDDTSTLLTHKTTIFSAVF